MTRRATTAAAALTGLLLAGCSGTPTPSADSSTPAPSVVTVTQTVAPTTPAPDTASAATDTPTAIGSDSRGYRYTLACSDTDETTGMSGDDTTYVSLTDAWADGGHDACTATTLTDGTHTTAQTAAIKAYQRTYREDTPIEALEAMYGICGASKADEGTLLNDDRGELAGAALLCPTAPHAATLTAIARGWTFTDGNYNVGSGPDQLPPGTYRSIAPASDCYWERTTAHGSTIANDMVTYAAKGALVTIHPSDGGFTSDGCDTWHRVK